MVDFWQGQLNASTGIEHVEGSLTGGGRRSFLDFEAACKTHDLQFCLLSLLGDAVAKRCG